VGVFFFFNSCTVHRCISISLLMAQWQQFRFSVLTTTSTVTPKLDTVPHNCERGHVQCHSCAWFQFSLVQLTSTSNNIARPIGRFHYDCKQKITFTINSSLKIMCMYVVELVHFYQSDMHTMINLLQMTTSLQSKCTYTFPQ
jgi:hypothetical protein